MAEPTAFGTVITATTTEIDGTPHRIRLSRAFGPTWKPEDGPNPWRADGSDPVTWVYYAFRWEHLTDVHVEYVPPRPATCTQSAPPSGRRPTVPGPERFEEECGCAWVHETFPDGKLWVQVAACEADRV